MSKTNELPRINSILGTDDMLVDTDSIGSGRTSFDAAAQFFKNIFMSGGVPYGKELTESWPALQARIKAGNFAGIHIGDFKTITLTTGEKVVMEVAGIDQYYLCSDQSIGHHVDFISRDCLSPTLTFNDTDTNNGTAAEPNPWRASRLFQFLNNETTGAFSILPADLKPCIIEKRMVMEKRYSAAGVLNDSAGWSWYNIGKLWVPTEVEVCGSAMWCDDDFGASGSRQYLIFIGSSRHLIKGRGIGGSKVGWWEASASRGNATNICYISGGGNADYAPASFNTICVPLCFRIG